METNSNHKGQELTDLGDLQLRRYADGTLLVRKKLGAAVFVVTEIAANDREIIAVGPVQLQILNGDPDD